MSLYGAFDQTKHFSELLDPLPTQEGVLTPAQRQSRALVNLGVQAAPVVVGDATTYAVLAGNSGLLHSVVDQTANITITLPAAAAGLNYEFMYGGAAADAQNHIIVPTAGFYIGSVCFMDTAVNFPTAVYSDGNSNDVFTIIGPSNYRVKFVSDGTNWYLNGYVNAATAPTLADT